MVDFWHMSKEGDWNFGIFVQFFMGAARVIVWLWMCCDSIPKRRYFLWTMIITWLVQMAIFVQIQGELFTGTQDYCDRKHVLEWMIESWGITCTGSIIILELGEILNLAAFAYFTAIAYEHFYIGSKNPKMLQKEAHRVEVMRASRLAEKNLKEK